MGNYKFKFSDMMPNAWFYKLKDGGKTRNHNIRNRKHQQTSSSSSTSSIAMPSEMQIADISDQRKSYHFNRDKAEPGPKHDTFFDNLATNLRALETVYPEPPRKSSKKRRSMKRQNRQSPRLATSSVSGGCSCKSTLESVWSKPPDSMPDSYMNSSSLDSFSSEHESISPQYGSDRTLIPETFDGMLLLSTTTTTTTTCRCGVESGFIIDMENKPFDKKTVGDPDNLNSFTTIPELDLPPIITRSNKTNGEPAKDIKKKMSNEPTKINRSTTKFEKKNAYGTITMKIVKEDIIKNSPKQQKPNNLPRSSVHSPGLKLRTNSPRIGSRRIQARKSVSSNSSSSSTKKDLSESFAVVKSSKDPQRDFKESMVEMIVENNMFASKDLEELLACYLSLNSDEYHEMIIKVFKQIWFDIIHTHLK